MTEDERNELISNLEYYLTLPRAERFITYFDYEELSYMLKLVKRDKK